MPPPQPRRHPDFAKDQQAGPPQPAGYPGYGPQPRPMYPGNYQFTCFNLYSF